MPAWRSASIEAVDVRGQRSDNTRADTYCKRQAIRDKFKGQIDEATFNAALADGEGLESALADAMADSSRNRRRATNAKMTRIRLVIRDEQAVFREGLLRVLSGQPPIAASGGLERGPPDGGQDDHLLPNVVVLDVRLAGRQRCVASIGGCAAQSAPEAAGAAVSAGRSPARSW